MGLSWTWPGDSLVCLPSRAVVCTAVGRGRGSRGSWPAAVPFCDILVLSDSRREAVESDELHCKPLVLSSFLITLDDGHGRRSEEPRVEMCRGSPAAVEERESGSTGMGELGFLGRSLKATFGGTSMTPARAAAFSKQLHYSKSASDTKPRWEQ